MITHRIVIVSFTKRNIVNYDIGLYIGLKLKSRRNEMGLTQQELGRSIGISFQQVQKYEKGANRISAANLFEIAKVLKVPVAYFFEGFDEFMDNLAPSFRDMDENFVHNDSFSSMETLNLINTYYRVENPKVRKKFVDLIESISASENEEREEK